MRYDGLGDAGADGGGSDGALRDALVQMVAAG